MRRYKPELTDLDKARDTARRTSLEADRIASENLRESGTTGGRYLSNRSVNAAQRDKLLGDRLTGIDIQEEQMNNQLLNQASMTNTNIYNQEQELIQREKDAARNAVSAGLSGIGEKVSGYTRDINLRKANQISNERKFNVLKNAFPNFVYDPETFELLWRAYVTGDTKTIEELGY